MSDETRTDRWHAMLLPEGYDPPALYEPGREPVHRRELAQLAEERAASFDDAPLVEIELPPGIEHAISVYAAGFVAGRAAFTIRPGLPDAERAAVLDAARSTTPAPGVAARVLSSGTGGPRKPIDLTAENLFASAGASAKRLSTGPGDVWLACLPMDHVGGLSILWRSWLGAHAALIHPRFDAEAVAESLASSSPRVTAISLVPTQLARLLDAGADLSGLRFALIGGAALPPALLERALDAGVPVAATYGLTEACSQVTTLPPSEARSRAGSSGRALPGTEVRIGHGKRIEVRGPTVAPGASGRDGWLRTGDIGRLDEDGYLWVEGRADDVIVSGGENVRPEPIEDRLREHPRVKDAAVVGVPDPEWGQAVVAFVAGPAGPAEPLVAHCRETLPPPSVPKRIEFVDEVPRTASGKLQRARLRAAAQGL